MNLLHRAITSFERKCSQSKSRVIAMLHVEFQQIFTQIPFDSSRRRSMNRNVPRSLHRGKYLPIFSCAMRPVLIFKTAAFPQLRSDVFVNCLTYFLGGIIDQRRSLRIFVRKTPRARATPRIELRLD